MGLRIQIVDIHWDGYEGDDELPDLVDITNDYFGGFGSFKHKESLKKSVRDMLDEIDGFVVDYLVKSFGVVPFTWKIQMKCQKTYMKQSETIRGFDILN